MTCTYDGAPVLELTATPAAGQQWTFAGNFAADFPDYQGFDPPYVRTLPSFIPGVAFSAPSFAATTKSSALTYAASVDLSTGSLAPLAPYLGPGPVKVTGPLEVRATPGFPMLDLGGPLGYDVPKLASAALRIATQDAVAGGAAAESIIELTAAVAPGDYHALDVSAPLLQAPYAWRLTGEPANPDAYSLAAGIEELGREVGTPLSLPTGLDGLSSLYLQAIVVGFKPASDVTALDLIGVRFGTLKGAAPVWSAPILGLRVDQIGIGWDVVGPMSGSPELLGQLTGKLAVGPAELDVQVSLSGLTTATTPDVAFAVSLDPATKLTVDALFEHFAGVDPGIGVEITELMLQGRTGTRSLQFVAALEPHWPDLPAGVNLLELTLALDYAPNAITAQTAARVKLLDLEWMLTAAYRGSGLGWRFSGALVPNAQTNNLQTIVNALDGGWFPDPLPANLGKIELRGLSASFETKGSDYSFDGTLGWPFQFPALGIDLDIEAGLKLEKSGDKPPSGTARGQLKVNELALGVVYGFGVKGNETLAFTVGYRGAELTCVISTNAKNEKILRAHLGGVSFGDIVGFLVSLAEDQSGFRLPAPWDVLYQLTFDRLSLEVNLTTRAIGVSYKLDVDLGIVKLDAIGLTYSKYAGSSSLVIDIEGTFFGTKYGDKDPPLSWDMLNEPPPAAPGKGEALLDLRFLALGQSVAMRRTTRFTGVADAIDALEKDFAPVEGDSNPLPALPALKFSGDGRWLIGADFTVMSAVSITGVFVDPSLYGLRIGLAGERMKKLAGLQFEILYQKVTDTIGLYHIELTLPTAMRNLQFGAVAVTLPIVTVDIYTNGNFYLDFGFPKGTDYSRSFTVQAGYFIGRGGFYFGVLDGATSDRVPVPTNGSFSPVIVFGVGLSVGVGRTLEAGPISGGVTITVEGTVEGVLGWFNPTDRSQPTDLYYHVKGTIAIVGKAWGVVDFVVVKASLSVTAYASVTLTVEAYKAIQVQLSVGVEVSASLTILFFTVSFSFSTSLDLSFTIGSDSTPPWRIATSAPADRPLQLRQQGTRHRPACHPAAPPPAACARAHRPPARVRLDGTACGGRHPRRRRPHAGAGAHTGERVGRRRAGRAGRDVALRRHLDAVRSPPRARGGERRACRARAGGLQPARRRRPALGDRLAPHAARELRRGDDRRPRRDREVPRRPAQPRRDLHLRERHLADRAQLRAAGVEPDRPERRLLRPALGHPARSHPLGPAQGAVPDDPRDRDEARRAPAGDLHRARDRRPDLPRPARDLLRPAAHRRSRPVERRRREGPRRGLAGGQRHALLRLLRPPGAAGGASGGAHARRLSVRGDRRRAPRRHRQVVRRLAGGASGAPRGHGGHDRRRARDDDRRAAARERRARRCAARGFHRDGRGRADGRADRRRQRGLPARHRRRADGRRRAPPDARHADARAGRRRVRARRPGRAPDREAGLARTPARPPCCSPVRSCPCRS